MNIVIFSSGNQKMMAENIKSKLEEQHNMCQIWYELFSRTDKSNKFALLPSLLKKIPTFDFAIILACADDTLVINRTVQQENHEISVPTEYQSMRDNVIFEIGLTVMALGQNKTILVAENGVRFFDDLIGITGVESDFDAPLNAAGIGMKCIEYNKRQFNISEITSQIGLYIEENRSNFSPVIIGAACSTAIGHFNMFIKRLIEYYNSENCTYTFNKKNHPMDFTKITIKILIPTYAEEDTQQRIENYYATHNYIDMSFSTPNAARPVFFKGKIKNNILHIIDIPTAISASYETAGKILSLDAKDIANSEDKERFIAKECYLFSSTIRKLAEDCHSDKVTIEIEKISLDKY